MTSVQMRAVQIRSFGGPEVLEVVTVPRPAAGPGEVLVQVEAAAVNQHDTFVRDGTLKMTTGRNFPMGLGLDFAGVVAAVGPGADDIAVGTRVWGMVSPKAGHVTGAAAEYVVVPADRLAAFPEHLTMVEAASLITSSESAVHAVRDVAKAKAGELLLVRGAAGSVGMIVVQFAHALGTHVTALAGARDVDFVTECGADEVLDYRTVGPKDIGPFDVIIDTAGTDLLAFRRRLSRQGRMVTVNFGSASAMASLAASTVFGARRIHTFRGYPDRQLLTDIAQYVEAGALRPVVVSVYTLAQIADAHRALSRPRRPGKLVLSVTAEETSPPI